MDIKKMQNTHNLQQVQVNIEDPEKPNDGREGPPLTSPLNPVTYAVNVGKSGSVDGSNVESYSKEAGEFNAKK